MRKFLVVLAATLAVPAPALAADVGAGAGIGAHATGVGTSDDGRTQVKASATYTGVLTANGLEVVGECDAEGIGAVASTAIERCYLVVNGQEFDLLARDLALPGNAVAFAGTKTVSAIPAQLCVLAEARPIVGDPARKETCANGAIGVTLPSTPALSFERDLDAAGIVLSGWNGSAFVCVARATGDAVRVAISRCEWGTARAPSVEVPGPIASTALVASAFRSEPVCFSATATFSDNTTQTVSGCGPMLPQGFEAP